MVLCRPRLNKIIMKQQHLHGVDYVITSFLIPLTSTKATSISF